LPAPDYVFIGYAMEIQGSKEFPESIAFTSFDELRHGSQLSFGDPRAFLLD